MRFRWGTEEDIDALAALVGRAFDDGPGVDLVALQTLAYRAIPAMSPTYAWLAEAADGRIVARWQAVALELTIRGVAVPAWGALGVAVDRDHRGGDALDAMLRAGRAAAAERGMALHLGFVTSGALWSRLGAEPFQPRYHVRFDVSGLPTRRAAALRPLPTDPLALLADADARDLVARHNRAVATRAGALRRDPVAWPFARHRARHLLAGPGLHLGYDLGESLHVLEAECDAPEGWRALLATAAAAARARGLPLTADLPPDHGLVAAARPHGVEVSVRWPYRSQGMAALEQPQAILDRVAPALPVGSLTWVIDGPGGARWTLDRGGPDLRVACAPGALLQLLLGVSDASALRAAGRLRADDDAVARLDALLPAGFPFTCASDRF